MSLNVSFDVARPYTKPGYNNSRRDLSNSHNKSVLNSSFRTNSASKHMSFSPTMTLAEYNQVKFSQANGRGKLPDLNAPQRVELPMYFNTPLRERPSRPKSRSPSPFKRKVVDNSFLNESQNKSVIMNNSNQNNVSFVDAARATKLNKYTSFVESEVKVGATRRLKDLTYIAQACKRAGKIREEGRAYYSMGVLYDNLKDHHKAIQYYKKFLSLCRSINDVNGEALAYNCLGVDYQILGDLGDKEMYQQSLKYHEKHKDIGNLAGKFTSSINLGMLYSSLGDEKNAILCQQHALRLAIELSDSNSQGIAIGNLGKIGTLEMSDNKTRMMAFVEKYLKLCKTKDNKQGEGDAYLKLGQILADEKNYNDGIKSYQKALDIGREHCDNGIIEKAKLGYGIAKGMSGMESYLDSMKKKMAA